MDKRCRGCEAFPKCTADECGDVTCRYLRYTYGCVQREPEGAEWRALPSRAEQLRAKTDEELAQWLVRLVDGCGELRYCQELPECDEDLNADREIPLERCAKCMLKWLREPGKLPPDTDDRDSCGLIEEG